MGHQISEIKAVVFDLGGVVIDLNRQAAIDALSEMGVPGVDKLLGEYEQNGPFRDLETGKLTAGAFYDYLRALAKGNGKEAPENVALQTAFNAFLVGLPVERLHRRLCRLCALQHQPGDVQFLDCRCLRPRWFADQRLFRRSGHIFSGRHVQTGSRTLQKSFDPL